MTEKKPEMILGSSAENAAKLETITDDMLAITKNAEFLALTIGETDRNFGWMRGVSRELDDGSTLELKYTIGRIEDNYAFVMQTIPSSDGGSKTIQRRWSNTSPADVSHQIVHGIRKRPGADPIESGHVGFTDKDIDRLKKLLNLIKEAPGG